jgi:2-polyprenyl-3-methyl-5-hydroxy-6-metoxy-1,4-benzoquinol methylase
MATDNRVKNYYEGFSKSVHLNDFRHLNWRLEAAKELCNTFIKKDARILEIGCGAGIVSRHLAKRGSKVLSVDISETGVKIARLHANLPTNSFLVLDVTEEGERLKGYGPFDAIVLADVIEHIPKEKHADLFRIIEEILAPDGIVLFTYPSSEYQEYLRTHRPDALQVVDEIVELTDLLSVTKLRPVYFRICDVWFHNQYTHLVLANYQAFSPVEIYVPFWKRFIFRVCNRLWGWRNRPLLRAFDDGVKK